MINLTGPIVESQDAAELASQAADWMVQRLDGQERLAVCLTGGSTPRRLYGLLAAEPHRSRIAWDRIHWFWGDERVVAPDDDRSNQKMVRETLLDHVPVASGQIHAVPTADEPDRCAQAYEDELKAFYGADELDPARPLFDIVLLGMGPDGHTASLFPGKQTVQETRRWVVASEPGLDPRVQRVTLTLPTLASSKATAFLISGAEKTDALGRISSGETLPAGQVRAQGELVWFIDRAAAGNRQG